MPRGRRRADRSGPIEERLLPTDSMSTNGLLYDANGDGKIDDLEELDRVMANDVYSLINEM